jgi:hypothetical protein
MAATEPDHPIVDQLKKDDEARRARVQSPPAPHPRDLTLAAAGGELIRAVNQTAAAHGLTMYEVQWLLVNIQQAMLHQAMQSTRLQEPATPPTEART